MRNIIAAAILAAAVVVGAPAAAYAAGPCTHVQQSTGDGTGLLNNLQVAFPVDLGAALNSALGLLGSATANPAGTTSCG